MCGIGGIIDTQAKEEDTRSRLEVMAEVMKYRGPDAHSIMVDGELGFVHNRLKIIDLSDTANQPMYSASMEHAIVFNGEIYNFEELKVKYELVNLKTSSDTEILLECIEKVGLEQALRDCRGMFALAIYHFPTKTLKLARDRYGQKPLYFSFLESRFTFCSDIRGVARNLTALELDFDALDYFLTEMSTPQPKSIFKGILQLEPGSIAELNGAKLDIRAYYAYELDNYDDSLTENNCLQMVEKELTEAIVLRSYSDVNLGYFLSGGIDSGLICSLMAQNSDRPIDTYTVIYDEKDFDESAEAKVVADRYKTNHHELKLDSSSVDQILWDLVNEMGEPFADSSALPSYYVTKAMKEHVTVAISGDGGDELFGYPEYGYALKLEEFQHYSKSTKKRRSFAAKVGNKFRTGNPYIDGALKTSLKTQLDGELLNRGMVFSAIEKEQLYRSLDLKKAAGYTAKWHSKLWNEIPSDSLFTKKWLGGFKTRLLNDYLPKVDRTSMFNSLEVRSPFLDHKLGELVAKIPPHFNFQNGHPKYLLKRLAMKHIAPDILQRKKIGFGVPITHWINNELSELINEHLSRERIEKRGLFNPDFIAKTIAEHQEGRADNRHKIWALLWLEMWMKQNIDRLNA
jgi:asparagine synthase (glutamine-hydrolysing)